MCERDWKRIAQREAIRYREHKAFIRGVEDASGAVTERYLNSVRWTAAIDAVLDYLHRHDGEQERFFRRLFGIDGARRYRGEKGMKALSTELCVSLSALYRWKNNLLSLLLLAAAQTGALRPFRIE